MEIRIELAKWDDSNEIYEMRERQTKYVDYG